MKAYDRGLLKRLVIQDFGEINTLTQRFNLPYEYTDVRKQFSENGVIFEENSPQELYESVKEFLADYQSGFSRKPTSKLVSDRIAHRTYSNKMLQTLVQPDANTPFPNKSELARFIYKNISAVGFLYCNSAITDR